MGKNWHSWPVRYHPHRLTIMKIPFAAMALVALVAHAASAAVTPVPVYRANPITTNTPQGMTNVIIAIAGSGGGGGTATNVGWQGITNLTTMPLPASAITNPAALQIPGGSVTSAVAAATVALSGWPLSWSEASIIGLISDLLNRPLTNDSRNLSFSGSNYVGSVAVAGRFSGAGSNLTSLAAGALTGTVPSANLGTGVADGSSFLRGDGTWAVPASMGGIATNAIANTNGTGWGTTLNSPTMTTASATNTGLRGQTILGGIDDGTAGLTVMSIQSSNSPSTFNWTVVAAANGDTEPDNVAMWGWNVGPGGANLVAGEPNLHFAMERHWNGVGAVSPQDFETHFEFSRPDGTTNYRAWTWNIGRTNGYISHRLRADQWGAYIGKTGDNTGDQWFDFSTNSTLTGPLPTNRWNMTVSQPAMFTKPVWFGGSTANFEISNKFMFFPDLGSGMLPLSDYLSPNYGYTFQVGADGNIGAQALLFHADGTTNDNRRLTHNAWVNDGTIYFDIPNQAGSGTDEASFSNTGWTLPAEVPLFAPLVQLPSSGNPFIVVNAQGHDTGFAGNDSVGQATLGFWLKGTRYAYLDYATRLFSLSYDFTGASNIVSTYGQFIGNGVGLTNLPAGQLTGTLADARLSANVPLLNGNQAFSGANEWLSSVQFDGTATVTNLLLVGARANVGSTAAPSSTNQMEIHTAGGNSYFGTNGTLYSPAFSGSGAGLTSLPAGQLTGTMADARLSANVPFLNGNQLFSGANEFLSSVQFDGTTVATNLLLVAGRVNVGSISSPSTTNQIEINTPGGKVNVGTNGVLYGNGSGLTGIASATATNLPAGVSLTNVNLVGTTTGATFVATSIYGTSTNTTAAFNSSGQLTAATAAQVVATLGSTAVAQATHATNADSATTASGGWPTTWSGGSITSAVAEATHATNADNATTASGGWPTTWAESAITGLVADLASKLATNGSAAGLTGAVPQATHATNADWAQKADVGSNPAQALLGVDGAYRMTVTSITPGLAGAQPTNNALTVLESGNGGALTNIAGTNLTSVGVTSGYVPTANGSGGVTWAAQTGAPVSQSGNYYVSTTIVTGTNSDQSGQPLYGYQSTIPTSSVRSYATTDFLTNGGYVGSVVTTNTFLSLGGTIGVNAFLGFVGGGGSPSLSMHAEVYYSYDKTNWYGDYSSQSIVITSGATNLYQWAISFPAYSSTNSSGFYVERRYRVDSVTGTGGRTLYVLIGTNSLSGVSDAAHITMQGPTTGGTVTSVNVAIPGLTSSGAVTSSGTITMTPKGDIITNGYSPAELSISNTVNAWNFKASGLATATGFKVYPLNTLNIASWGFPSSYETNLSANIVLSAPTIDDTSFEGAYILCLNSSGSDKTVTLPANVRSMDGSRVYTVTNGTARELWFRHFGTLATNVTTTPIY